MASLLLQYFEGGSHFKTSTNGTAQIGAEQKMDLWEKLLHLCAKISPSVVGKPQDVSKIQWLYTEYVV